MTDIALYDIQVEKVNYPSDLFITPEEAEKFLILTFLEGNRVGLSPGRDPKLSIGPRLRQAYDLRLPRR